MKDLCEHDMYQKNATIKFPWLHKSPDLSLTLAKFPDISRIRFKYNKTRESMNEKAFMEIP